MAFVSGRAIRRQLQRSGFDISGKIRRSDNQRNLSFFVSSNISPQGSDKGQIDTAIQEAAGGGVLRRIPSRTLSIFIGAAKREPRPNFPHRTIRRVSVTVEAGRSVEL